MPGDWNSSPQSAPPTSNRALTFLDVVVGQGAAILQLFASKDQSLLVRGDAFLVLDLGLDILDGVTGLDLKSDGLARQGLHEDLHVGVCCTVEGDT